MDWEWRKDFDNVISANANGHIPTSTHHTPTHRYLPNTHTSKPAIHLHPTPTQNRSSMMAMLQYTRFMWLRTDMVVSDNLHGVPLLPGLISRS